MNNCFLGSFTLATLSCQPLLMSSILFDETILQTKLSFLNTYILNVITVTMSSIAQKRRSLVWRFCRLGLQLSNSKVVSFNQSDEPLFMQPIRFWLYYRNKRGFFFLLRRYISFHKRLWSSAFQPFASFCLNKNSYYL